MSFSGTSQFKQGHERQEVNQNHGVGQCSDDAAACSAQDRRRVNQQAIKLFKHLRQQLQSHLRGQYLWER